MAGISEIILIKTVRQTTIGKIDIGYNNGSLRFRPGLACLCGVVMMASSGCKLAALLRYL